MLNPGIVRNRLKVNSIIKNAKGYLAYTADGRISLHFMELCWGKPIVNQFTTMSLGFQHKRQNLKPCQSVKEA